jgi:hypothetical protein
VSSLPAQSSEVNLGGLRAFADEIFESMRNSLAFSDWNELERVKSLVLEVNSSKLAYNIHMDDVARQLFLTFMNQQRFGPTLDEMKKVILLLSYYSILNQFFLVDDRLSTPLEQFLQAGAK